MASFFWIYILCSVLHCSWEAIPTSEFSHDLANWLTKIMMLPVLSLDIRGPSVLCLSLYTSTTFIGKIPRLGLQVRRGWKPHGAEVPLIATLAKPALIEASSLTTYTWTKCPQKPRECQMRCANPHPPDPWDIIINVCLSHWDLMWFIGQQ